MLSFWPTETITSAEATTLTFTLYVTATDPSPVEGPIRMSLDDEDRTWEDHLLPRTAGETVADGAAGDGSAWHVRAGTPGLLYGPYTDSLLAGRPYRAYFRLKAPAGVLTSTLELARLDVVRDGGGELLGVRYLRGTDFKAQDAYQEFALDFDYIHSGELEFRTYSYGVSDLWVDRVSVASYPAYLLPQVGGELAVSWTLPAREGPTTIRARFVDGAENTSPQSSLVITVTDRSPPGQWRQFQCNGVTCTVRARDAIAGLDVHSAAYRIAVGSEPSWGDWRQATCSGEDGSHDWETLTITSPVALIDTVTAISVPTSYGQIQFRAYDVAAVPNEGRSPIYVLYQVHLPLVMRPQD
jgi:hypothetical protein